jgi:hypothetical protein
MIIVQRSVELPGLQGRCQLVRFQVTASLRVSSHTRACGSRVYGASIRPRRLFSLCWRGTYS